MTVTRLAYVTREQVKQHSPTVGPDQDQRIDDLICDWSEGVEADTRRYFIPRTFTNDYDWPEWWPGIGYRLWTEADLLSVTKILVRAQDTSPTEITAGQYFVRPERYGPPYTRIEINLSTGAAFQAGLSYQNSVSVEGTWGYRSQTVPAGTLAGTIDDAATTLACSNASLIGVGDSLLIGAEQILVVDRGLVDTNATLNGALDAQLPQTGDVGALVALSGSNLVYPGEVLTVDAERMYVEAVAGANIVVRRAYEGSALAAHDTGAKLYAPRSLTVARAQGKKADGTGGTTPASHADTAPISRYIAPSVISSAVRARVISVAQQEIAGWGRTVGTGEGQHQYSGREAQKLWDDVVRQFGPHRVRAV